MSFSKMCGSEDVESSCLKIDLNNTDIGTVKLSIVCLCVGACEDGCMHLVVNCMSIPKTILQYR